MGTRQLAMATTALGLWLKRACFPLQLDHVIDELDRHTEMRRRGAVRVTFFYEIDHTCPKFHWMGFAHVCLPMMLTNTESQIKQIGNPESHQREHALILTRASIWLATTLVAVWFVFIPWKIP